MPDKCGGFYMKKDGAAKNYYGSLCTRMYEILHEKAPQDELDFYLSYAKKGKRILEALCGSGRFFVPFYERGFDIHGVDLSAEMLEKLLEKAPDANVVCKDIVQYAQNNGLIIFLFLPDRFLCLQTWSCAKLF